MEELKALAQQMATKSWWQASRHLMLQGFSTYLGLEAGASRLSFYQPLMVPGLLQINEYAKAVELPYFPDDTAEDLERRVEVRMRRAAVLIRKRRPIDAEFVLHECVCRRWWARNPPWQRRRGT